jgi:hypothetical protein
MMRIIIKCTHEKSIKFESDELFENFFVTLFKFKIVHHRQCRCYSFHDVNAKVLERNSMNKMKICADNVACEGVWKFLGLIEVFGGLVSDF